MEYQVLHIDGWEISYRVCGDKDQDRIPILFFHGFGSSGTCINQVNEDLSMIVVNRPGYGNSSLVKNYRMTDFADKVKELLTRLDVKKIHLMGWSAGGAYAQIFAHRFPEMIASLSLISSAVLLQNVHRKVLPGNWWMIRWMNSWMPFVAKSMFKKMSKDLNAHLDKTIEKSIKQMVEGDRIIANKADYKKRIALAAIESYQHEGWPVYYDAIAMTQKVENPSGSTPYPVYIWQGEADEIWTMKTANYLHEKYNQSSLMTVENGGHLFYLDWMNQIVETALYERTENRTIKTSN